ncbi:MAG TPA: hypothetical protein DDW50_16790 [Firmicutes bacterium]|jgi:hypothetical protein|nr:hypothetical protein [Bacillota bacterium]
MKEASAKPKRKISPFTLIISGAGLIACIYLLLSSQPPASAPAVNNNNTANIPAATEVPGSVQQGPGHSQHATPTPSPTSVQNAALPGTADKPNETSRDPFLPAIKKAETSQNVSQTKSAPARPLFSGAKTKATVPKDDRFKPVWNGTIGTASDQVVLISFRGKPYILHPGDPIPGTDYQVAEIHNDFILLNSSKKSLPLYLRKETPNDKTKSL